MFKRRPTYLMETDAQINLPMGDEVRRGSPNSPRCLMTIYGGC